MNELSYSKKKYLFAIYKLCQSGGEAKSTEVAKIVGVSKASTAAMAAKLCESGYIKKEHYGQISLTESGIKAANSIFTSCVIIREFLENTLGLDMETADSDAVKIVVHTSEKTVNKLAEHLLKG
ncbi:MAG: metal-dependent transcriptional regulator [Oscillospiraceae bacterium]|nr:metal-dependent transcriptional regulator [Oscillospiraceae bacterium]